MGSLNEINEAVDIYIKNEMLLSQYYSLCIPVFMDHAEKFAELSKQEKEHADFFREIKKSIAVNANSWSMGSCNIKTIVMIGEEITSKIDEILSDTLNHKRIISFIADVEHSLIETEFHKAFKTDIPEYTNMLARIMRETINHQNTLREILLKMDSFK